MKKSILFLLISLGIASANAQSQTTGELIETANTFLRQGDYANAILVLNRAQQQDPQNTTVAKNLALSYYFQNDNDKASAAIKPALDKEDADDQVFQIAANIYQHLGQPKEAEKVYRKGIKKFADSGPLYNDLGELLAAQQNNNEAIKQWEKGIETDPSYSKNYYNAAKYYFTTNNNGWALLYAEIFINIEPMSNKAPEIKQLLLDGYKKLFINADLLVNNKDKNVFVNNYLQSMNHVGSIASMGINTESLTMIRTRFILDWYHTQQNKYPFKLFELQQQLLKEGMFDAYNEWLFEPTINLVAYQNWISAHPTENKAFTDFQRGRIFKIPKGQYYH